MRKVPTAILVSCLLLTGCTSHPRSGSGSENRTATPYSPSPIVLASIQSPSPSGTEGTETKSRWIPVSGSSVCSKVFATPLLLHPVPELVGYTTPHKGRLVIQLVNNTGVCDDLPKEAADLSGDGLRLLMFPLGSDNPTASANLPDLSSHLASGEAVGVPVTLNDVPPGYYRFSMEGQVTWKGSTQTRTFTPPGGEYYNFLRLYVLVTDGARVATSDHYPGSTVNFGGIHLPSELTITQSPNGNDFTTFKAQMPINCDVGTDRYVELGGWHFFVEGVNFRTWIPEISSGHNLAEATWGLSPIPKEASSVTAEVLLKVRSCKDNGAPLAEGTVSWQILLGPTP
jgi:hypothetical protein